MHIPMYENIEYIKLNHLPFAFPEDQFPGCFYKMVLSSMILFDPGNDQHLTSVSLNCDPCASQHGLRCDHGNPESTQGGLVPHTVTQPPVLKNSLTGRVIHSDSIVIPKLGASQKPGDVQIDKTWHRAMGALSPSARGALIGFSQGG